MMEDIFIFFYRWLPFKELNPLCTRTLSSRYLFWVDRSLSPSTPLGYMHGIQTFLTVVSRWIHFVEFRSLKHGLELALRIKLVIRFSSWQRSRMLIGLRTLHIQSRIRNIQLTENSRD